MCSEKVAAPTLKGITFFKEFRKPFTTGAHANFAKEKYEVPVSIELIDEVSIDCRKLKSDVTGTARSAAGRTFCDNR